VLSPQTPELVCWPRESGRHPSEAALEWLRRSRSMGTTNYAPLLPLPSPTSVASPGGVALRGHRGAGTAPVYWRPRLGACATTAPSGERLQRSGRSLAGHRLSPRTARATRHQLREFCWFTPPHLVASAWRLSGGWSEPSWPPPARWLTGNAGSRAGLAAGVGCLRLSRPAGGEAAYDGSPRSCSRMGPADRFGSRASNP